MHKFKLITLALDKYLYNYNFNMQEFETKISSIKNLTAHDIELVVELQSPASVVFQAGQFMQFKIGEVYRSYSISCMPNIVNNSLQFCIGLFETGVGSNFFRQAKVGDIIDMRGPFGVFVFKDFNRNVTFVATGVGVAPFSSIIPDMLTKGYSGNVKLLFGVRHEEDIFYFDKFSHLSSLYPNFKFLPMLSRPKSHWPGETGRVTNYLDAHFQNLKDNLFYVCGGMEMIKDTRAILLKNNHPTKEIKLEIFT